MFALVDNRGQVVAYFTTADAAIAAKFKKLNYKTYRVVETTGKGNK